MKVCANPECKKEFKPKRLDTQYCSTKCNYKVYYQKYKQKFIDNANKWRLTNPESRKKILSKNNKKTYRKKIQENPNYNAEQYLKYKDRYNYNSKQYKKNNKEFINSLNNKRRSLKLKAIPKFANLDKIKEIYKNCPKGYHVDHIIPLNNPIVCGLHVEWNLQYLSAKENCSKGNKLL